MIIKLVLLVMIQREVCQRRADGDRPGRKYMFILDTMCDNLQVYNSCFHYRQCILPQTKLTVMTKNIIKIIVANG